MTEITQTEIIFVGMIMLSNGDETNVDALGLSIDRADYFNVSVVQETDDGERYDLPEHERDFPDYDAGLKYAESLERKNGWTLDDVPERPSGSVKPEPSLFEKFQASRKAVDCLEAVTGNEDYKGRAGFTYEPQSHIEKGAHGKYFLDINNHGWMSEELDRLERILWREHAVDALDDVPHPSDVFAALMPLQKNEDGLTTIYGVWLADMALPPMCAVELLYEDLIHGDDKAALESFIDAWERSVA